MGVYAVGRPPKTALERAAAAVLACGPDAALSHFGALALWELSKRWPAVFDVVVVSDRNPKGINTHRFATLTTYDLRTRHGIRVTGPARTLLDCAPQMTPKALTRAVNEAQLSRVMKRWQLAELLERSPTHRGTRLLQALLTEERGLTRSELEDLFVDFCKRFGLPRPQTNAKVAGYEVDALFKDQRVIVELDSWSFHQTRDSFERDRNRDADTLAAGYVTTRVTQRRLTREPQKEAGRLRAILDRADRRP